MSKAGLWDRVQKTPVPKEELARRNRNTAILTNALFLQACESVGTEPTKRQASKWNNKKGLAYKFGRV